MHFIKMHGISNDYIYLDAFTDPGVESLADRADWPSIVARLCDRHRGVGGDGVILVCRPKHTDAHARMRMFNADASESQMCGNGVRCVAKFAHDRLGVNARPMRIETGRGTLSIDYRTDAQGHLIEATVDMGEPILDAAKIPTTLAGNDAGRIIDLPLTRAVAWDVPEALARGAGLLEPTLTCVSMGNPHAVIFCAHAAGVPLEQWGPYLERQPIFPERINVHFVQVVSPSAGAEVILRTWERGSGITQACGTGACAVAVAAVLTRRADAQRAADDGLLVHLPGGDLRIVVSRDHAGRAGSAVGRVLMTGPAEVAFEGDVSIPPIAN